jgi:molybdopterin-guanine dinucleotide biosynthesis protein A
MTGEYSKVDLIGVARGEPVPMSVGANRGLQATIRCGGIVLCGGRSSRMGLDKASLPFGDETMLARVVRLLATVVQPIVVVAAPGQVLPELPADVLVARDSREGLGPLAGLQAGLAAIQDHAECAYATSCDVPLLVPGLVRAMIERLGDADVVVPVEGTFHHPLAAVYQTRVLPSLEALLAADRLRPVYLFEQVATCRVPIAELAAVDPELATLRNLNRPEDYLAALAHAGFAPDPAIVAALRASSEKTEPRT